MKITKTLFIIFALLLLTAAVEIKINAQTPQTNQEKLAAANKLFDEAMTLFDKGTAESYQSSLIKFQSASRLYEEIKDKSEKAGMVTLVSGLISDNLGEKSDALKFYGKALIFFQLNNYKNWEATTLNNIALVYANLSENQKALNYFNQSLSLFKIVGNKQGEAGTLSNIGAVYMALGENQKALDYCNLALPLIKQVGDKSGEAMALIVIGGVYSILGDKQKALDYFKQGLELTKQIDDKSGQAKCLANIGGVYVNKGENQQALDYYNLALPLMKQVGDKSGEAATLSGIGKVYDDLGEKQKAIEYYNLALSLIKQVGDISGEATILNNIGAVYIALSENQKALNYLTQSLLLFRAINDKRGESLTLNNIGKVYSDLGEKQKAIEYYNLALSLMKQIGDKLGEATTLNNIGAIYMALGEIQKAFDYYYQSLPIRRTVGDKSGEATTLNNIGLTYYILGEKQTALDYYAQSLQLGRIVGNKQIEAITLNNIADIYKALNENQKALDYYAQSFWLSRTIGDKRQVANALNNIGVVYLDLGENQKALEYFQLSLPLSKYVGNINLEAMILSSLSYYWNVQKNQRLAVFYSKQSINLYEKLRTNIGGLDKEVQKTFLKKVESNYRSLAYFLIERGRLAEAQQVLDLFKDQQFFDFNRTLNEPVKQLVQTPREVEFAARYDKSSAQIGKIGQQIEDLKKSLGTRQSTTEESVQLQKFESDLKIATDAFLAVLKEFEIEFSKPSDDKDKIGEVPDNREMKSALANLNQQTGQKTVAVYTLVSEDKYHALIVSPDDIKAVSFPIKGDELNAKAKQLWGLLQSDKYDTTVLSKQIYDVVFAPLEKELPKDTTTIMWSLDGNLRYLPMAALWDGKQFLAERYNHVNFTRADSERMLKNLNPNWTGTGLGTTQPQIVDLFNNGDKINFSALPGVTEELEEIFKQPNSNVGILSGEVLPDAKFTKTNFLESMKQHRPVVHIASHFSFRPGDEVRSFLLMGDGTAFTLNDMKKETNLFQAVLHAESVSKSTP